MYFVAKRFGRGPETRLQEFSKEPDAIVFIMEKLREDKHFNLNAIYCLYEGADLLREFSQTDLPTELPTAIAESDSSASQKGSEKSFRPTPFSTTPRLGPQSWISDDKKDEDEKKS